MVIVIKTKCSILLGLVDIGYTHRLAESSVCWVYTTKWYALLREMLSEEYPIKTSNHIKKEHHQSKKPWVSMKLKTYKFLLHVCHKRKFPKGFKLLAIFYGKDFNTLTFLYTQDVNVWFSHILCHTRSRIRLGAVSSTYFLLLSVIVIPSADTLNVATVVSSTSLPNVWCTALEMAWGPVRDSVSTLFMYTTLHAANE